MVICNSAMYMQSGLLLGLQLLFIVLSYWLIKNLTIVIFLSLVIMTIFVIFSPYVLAITNTIFCLG